MTIEINEKQYELKYSFRALMIYENITKKTFNPKTVSDMVVFFYSVVLAANKGCELLFDDFLDWIDANPTSITDFSKWLESIFTQQNEISPTTEVQEELSKKKKETDEAVEKN